MRQLVPTLGPSVANQAMQVNNQLTLNLYPRMEGPGAKQQVALYHTPGLTSLGSNSGDGRCNGVIFQSKLYFVIGNSLVSIDSSDTITDHGTLNTTTGRVWLAAGRTYLLIVDGTNGYTWDGSTFAVITAAAFPDDATHAVYLDGNFLVNDAGTDDFYKSDGEDATTWGALDFEVAAASPDNIVGLAKFDRDFFAFGTDTVQRFYNSGNADFPFTPYPRNLEVGLLAPYSLAQTTYGIFALCNIPDGDAVVMQFIGGDFQVVSDPDTSSEISRLSTNTDAIGSIYTQEGHTFYVLTFPTEGLTKVYDVTQKMWHDRSSYPLNKWRVSGLGFISGKVIGIDFTDGNIYHVSRSVYTDNGTHIERKRRTQVLHNNRTEFIIWRSEHEFQSGLATGDPQVLYRYSWDGGFSFSDWRQQALGDIGKYSARTAWYQLGDGVEFIDEVTITDATPVTMIGGYMDIEVKEF